MEINFYIWLVLTIAVTAYAWIVIARWTKKKDSEENYADYSYAEMFGLLEKYIEIMPNKSKKYNIKDLLKF